MNKNESFYNHIGNGGYSFEVVTENSVQHLKISMSNFGIKQTYSLMLSENVLESLELVIEAAKKQRTYFKYSPYVEETIHREDSFNEPVVDVADGKVDSSD
jgi:hypothetical protein